MKYLKGIILLILVTSCTKNKIETASVLMNLNFSHNWSGTSIENSDLNTIKFTNANGEQLSIERLRYLISNITLTNTDGEKTIIKERHLVNLNEEKGLELVSDLAMPQGTYKLSFVFGLTDADNIDGVYQDLNSITFNVPTMLGGGYHFMQFDGKFNGTNSQINNFNFHAIRAVNRTDPANLIFQDTSFEVSLGDVIITELGIVEVKMDVSEWFKNPNLWDLNTLNSMLMPNFNAQVLMSANGKSVFSLGAVTP
jgi:hypothetical protein